VPDKGELHLNRTKISGEDLFVEPEKRGVGIVFQDFALFPHMTVWENIGFGLFRMGKTDKSNRIKEVTELTGLQGLEKRYPHQLSGGQRQRAALARAMAPNPSLILFDEPFSNLDSVLKNQMRGEIRNILKTSGTTAIFVTHDTKDVLAIADRAVVLKEGRTLQTGSPDVIYTSPATRYVATFFGKTNFIQARPVKGGFETALGFISFNSEPYLQQDELTISIRPGSIMPADVLVQHAIRAKILSKKFFGEYTELLVEVSDAATPQVLTIHAGLQHKFMNELSWFKIDQERMGVISDTVK
jgi:iron(III) transport system ATP-binding protein